MKIAIISDIHSNIYALNAVLEDIENRNVDLIACTGDLVGYGTRPNEVISTIRKNRILTIMGNYDDAIGNRKIVCGCDYPDPIEDNKNYLSSLPKDITLSFNNKTIRLVHGSTRLINEYLKENSNEAKEVMEELTEDILICGHTHIPYVKYYGEKLLVNAGSVGKPKTNNPAANYVIISIDDSAVQTEIVEVDYDFEKAAKEIEENDILPNDFARLLREGSSK